MLNYQRVDKKKPLNVPIPKLFRQNKAQCAQGFIEMADWYRSNPNRVAGGVEVPQSHRSATGQGRGDISSLPQDQIPFYHNGHNMVGKWVMWLTRQN